MLVDVDTCVQKKLTINSSITADKILYLILETSWKSLNINCGNYFGKNTQVLGLLAMFKGI